jgi:glutamate-1-semialdehyde 2,1-aminomutase
MRGPELYVEAKRLIPGGTQLLSKRPELFAPERWPAYYREARGCEVTDLDGRTYLDFTHNGVGSCLLGYAHPRVVEAVVDRVRRGSMCSLNSPEEVELAKRLLSLHPWADQVRFARCGGESLSVAVRIARAATRRDVIAFCGYHGWSDWYLAANLSTERALDGHLLPGLSPAGVPRGLTGTAMPFAYNRLDELEQIVTSHGANLAAVVMEPTRNMPPAPGFMSGVRALCDEAGAKLVFDEVTTGFRFRSGGYHLDFFESTESIVPDLAVFAKALGSGHPMAAVIGRRESMEAAQDSFLSSTYWTEGVGPVAALATLDVLAEQDVPGHARRIGEQFRKQLAQRAAAAGLSLKIGGYPQLTTIAFDHPDAAALLTLFTVRMLDRGMLASGGFYPTLGHTPAAVEAYMAAAEPVLAEVAHAASLGDAVVRLGGLVKQSGFARLT